MQGHVEQLIDWIDQESAAQAKQLDARRQQSGDGGAERTGETLLNMALVDTRPGLAGTTIATFVKRNRELSLPPNRFRVGTPVLTTVMERMLSLLAEWLSQRFPSLKVSLPFVPDGGRYRLDVSRTRSRVRTESSSRWFAVAPEDCAMKEVLLGGRTPSPRREPRELKLNVQLQLYSSAFQRRMLALFTGLQTGKTTTVVELIKASVKQGQRYLPPHQVILLITFEKLVAEGVKSVRLEYSLVLNAAC